VSQLSAGGWHAFTITDLVTAPHVTKNMSISVLTRLTRRPVALEFGRAWAAYAAVEWAFSVIVPSLTRPSYDYLRPHLGFSVLLLILYPIWGFLLGALSERLVRGAGGHGSAAILAQKARALGTLTVVLAFGINLFVQNGLELPLAPIFAACTLLMLLCAVSSVSDRWTAPLSPIVSPWTASLLMLGLTWLTRDFLSASSRVVKVAAAGGYLAALVAFALLVATSVYPRVRAALPQAAPVFRFPRYIALLLTLAVIAATTLTQRPKIQPAEAATRAAASHTPNIVLIVLDTVRADHLSVYGYERDTTPNLRAFAEQATMYPRAISPSNMTLPSHASLFSGLYPGAHGAHFAPGLPLGRGLAPETDTIAEVLARGGYRTTAVAANYAFLGPAFQLDQGFEHYDQRAPVRFVISAQRHFQLYLMKAAADLLARMFTSLELECPFFTAEEINQAVFNRLGSRSAGERPEFLFLNYMDAHWPYLPPAPFDARYPGKDPTFTIAEQQHVIDQVIASNHVVTSQERNHWISQYDGGIAYLDAQLGGLFARLKELALWDDSLIIVTSDHGEAFGERNVLGHAIFAYQNQVHVPLLIKYPGQTVQRVVQETVSGIDIFPTILEVARLPIPATAQGRSLLSLEPGTPRHVFTETFPSERLPDPVARFHTAERAIFEWPMKFIVSTGGKQELYDLSGDPNEERDLRPVEADVANSLGQELFAWVKTVSPVAASPGIVDKATRDRLKSLGYTR